MIEIDLMKLERGTKTEWRTVTRGGKTFKQRFKVGKKEDEKHESIQFSIPKTKDEFIIDTIGEINNLHNLELQIRTLEAYVEFFTDRNNERAKIFKNLLNHTQDKVKSQKIKIDKPKPKVLKPKIPKLVRSFPDMGKETDISGKMIPENIVNVTSLKKLGITSGVHAAESDLVDFGGAKGIYKTAGGEATFAENAYFNLSKVLGWNIVPETTTGDFGRGEGSCQRWIPNTESPKRKSFSPGMIVGPEYYDDLSKIFLMDVIAGNTDRHSGNAVFKDGKAFAIDNGICAGGGNFFVMQEMIGLDALAGINDEKETFKMSSWLGASMPLDKKEGFVAFRNSVYKNLKNISEHKEEILNIYKNAPSERQQKNVRNNLDSLTEISEWNE